MARILWIKLLVVLSILSSCNVDDDRPEPFVAEGILEINGNPYELKLGFIENNGLYEEGIFKYEISLYTDLNASDNENSTENHLVSSISFGLLSTDENMITNDSYDFNSSVGLANTTSSGIVFENCNLESSQGGFDCEGIYLVSDGSVTINETVEFYDLEFSFNFLDGGSAEGHYVGRLYDN